jgi:hypothetical protein
MTAVTNATFTAAQFNTHVRDNLLETAPAKATAADRFILTDGANAVREQAATKQNWVPAQGGWNWGGGAIETAFRIVNGVLFWRLHIIFDGAATFSGTFAFTLPFGADGGDANAVGYGNLWDASSSANRVPVIVRTGTASGLTCNLYSASGLVTATSPFTFASTDEISLSGACLLASQIWQP